jgi:hypothetical protein
LFLDTLFRGGAFPGRTADEAYLVRCGRDTMTQDDIDNGRLMIQIGVAPVRPAELVIFRIGQWLSESTERFDGAGRPSQRLCLRRHPVGEEGAVVQVAKAGAWATWREVADLGAARPGDCVYCLDRESGALTFGDGDHGALLPAGSQNVRVAYRHGAGED